MTWEILAIVFSMLSVIAGGAIAYGKLLQNVKSLERDIQEIKESNLEMEKRINDDYKQEYRRLDTKVCSIETGMKRGDGRSVFLPRSEFEEYKDLITKKIDFMCTNLTSIREALSNHGEILASLKARFEKNH